MTTITRERLLKIQQWSETYGAGSNVMLPAEEAEELARIALASLEAKPVAYMSRQNATLREKFGTCDEWDVHHQSVGADFPLIEIPESDDYEIMPLHILPPAPVVPEKMNFSTACNFVQINGMAKEDRATLAMRAWNACRAAMLNGGKS